MLVRRSTVFLIMLTFFTATAISREKPIREMSITRIAATPPSIDGKLDDAIWQQGTWEGNFSQYIPNENAKPSQETEFKIFHDDTYIYARVS